MTIARHFPPALIRRLSRSLARDAAAESAIPSYAHWNPAIRWLMFRRLQVISREARAALNGATTRGNGSALDFGCGIGMMIPVLAPMVKTLYLCDEQIAPSRETAQWFDARNVVHLLPNELGAQIPDGSVDVIIAADVLEHVDELPELLAQFRRKLRAEGLLIVSGPTENRAYRFGRWLAGFSGDYHVRDVYDVEAEVARAGFARHSLRQLPPVPRLFRITLWVPRSSPAATI